MAVLFRLPLLACHPLSICLGLAVCCLRPMALSLNSLGGDGVIYGAFRLWCVLPVLLASLLCCRRNLLLLLPLVLVLEARVVVVYWVLAYP